MWTQKSLSGSSGELRGNLVIQNPDTFVQMERVVTSKSPL